MRESSVLCGWPLRVRKFSNQALAQAGFLHHHVTQTARRHHQRVHRFHRHAVHQRRAIRQLRQLPCKVSGPMLDHVLAGRIAAALADLDLARQNQDQAGRDLSRLHYRRTGFVMADLAETLQTRDIVRVQHGKHLLAAGFDNGGCRHGGSRTPLQHATDFTLASAGYGSVDDCQRSRRIFVVESRIFVAFCA
jgi:hypothetical protein